MLEWEQVMVLPLVSGKMLWADRTPTRTPDVPEPFVALLSMLYVFPALSLHVRNARPGSEAKEMIMLFPAATPEAGTVIVVVVPVLVVAAVPIVLTNAIWAETGETNENESRGRRK
jgi:hypothetical protein